MASLGYSILLATFVVAVYAATASENSVRCIARATVESGIGAFHLIAALMSVASAVIVHAFVTGDYSIKYIARYSESAQPLFYKLTSYWGGLDGSIMFWVFLLSLMGSLAVQVNRERHRELIPWVVAVISVVQLFFLFLMIVHNNPFETYLLNTPADGEGLSPLLQNYWMVIHPPSLYIGFVGMTVPFAFGMAALITGHLDDAWLRAVRRWTMFAWLFLTFGLTLGMIWAYEELGWGGYWGWDPVENAGLLPWFTATAFLHSVMVQERRSMLRVWNVTLVIVTFFLTIFGTFMTRSGVVQSVHAFGEDPALARMFTVFMVAILVVSFGLVVYRLPLLRARNELDSWASREAAFLVNNWILLFAAFFILFVTMFPTLSEAVTGERLTVSAPFYNKWMIPVGLILLFLTGVGPLLAWRKSSVSNMVSQFTFPVSAALVTLAALWAAGLRVWSSGICFALCAFVAGTILQEFWRGTMVRRRSTGGDVLGSLVGLVARSRRRYGGYIVHLGIVLIFLGFAGEGYKREVEIALAPGQEATIGQFTVRNDAIRVSDDGRKQMVTAYVTVLVDGREAGTMYPARWFFRKHENEPTTEVAIRRSVGEDLYVNMANYDVPTQTGHFQIFLNPLVNWIWLGFGIVALGTGLALLPERAFGYALAKLPPEGPEPAAAVAPLVLLVAVPAAAAQPAPAEHEDLGQGSLLVPTTQLEKDLQRAIICMCGTCGRKLLSECTCGTAASMRQEIAGLVKQGKSYDDVIEYHLAKYGSQEPLAAPIDRGFNRLAWLLPYVLGAGGLLVAGVTAVRWSRRAADAPQAQPSAAADPALEARLDDELSNLD